MALSDQSLHEAVRGWIDRTGISPGEDSRIFSQHLSVPPDGLVPFNLPDALGIVPEYGLHQTIAAVITSSMRYPGAASWGCVHAREGACPVGIQASHIALKIPKSEAYGK